MKLNSKGKLAKFYMWLPPEDKRLPQDFCTFFWGLVGRAFFIVGLCGTVLAALIFAAVSGILFLWAHKVPTLFILAALLVMALAIWLSERKKKIKIEFLSEVRTVVRGKVDAVKNRYCPRIDWK